MQIINPYGWEHSIDTTRNAHERDFIVSTAAWRGNYYKQKVRMFISNKSEFAETLYDQFRVSEKWRKTNSKRYQHDPRNAEAAKLLFELNPKSSSQTKSGTGLDRSFLIPSASQISVRRTARLDFASTQPILRLGLRTCIPT
jgi:hypothetical protein